MNVKNLFLDYFVRKQHKLISSSSLIPINDKSLLFTNSGMVQFKDIFLGNEKVKYKKIVTCQKCMRAGGKHNDLENIGFTNRHHSFFEMLGNFSFGDYFKEEAIELAWDFLINHLSLNKKRLFISVHADDIESADIWLKKIKIEKDHLSYLGDDDNFWQMGETGPCGPSTEIYYDLGEELSGSRPGNGITGDRFTEIWNLVFTQFNRDEKGNLSDLPVKCVDTGMGLERIQAVIEGKTDNYKSSVFSELNNFLNESSQIKKIDFSIKKIIMDHVRASCFLIVDGVIPDKENRGYVLRRIIRRAVRYLYNVGIKSPYLYKCVDIISSTMKNNYPQLNKEKNKIKKILLAEEENCLKTLSVGLRLINNILEKNNKLSDEETFKLYDTYGFPIEIIQEIAQEKKFSLDLEGFNILMDKQKERSKNLNMFDVKDKNFIDTNLTTKFVGYSKSKISSKVIAIYNEESNKIDSLKNSKPSMLIMDATPFYAEGGGQHSDFGMIENDSFKFIVENVQYINNVIVHFGKLETGAININDTATCIIDLENRQHTAANHSATHLLHQALRETLGDTVQQRGSSVTNKHLTFDFTHDKALSSNEISRIENDIAREIEADIKTDITNMKYNDAIKKGALALFDEKYSENVRVLKIGSKSLELCGGTHVKSTSEIKVFKILGESSVSTGIRRIEAITGHTAYTYFQKLFDQNKEVSQLLNAKPNELKNKIQDFKNQQSMSDKKAEETNKILAKYLLESLELAKRISNETSIFIKGFKDLDSNQIKSLSDLIKTKYSDSISVFCLEGDGKINCFIGVSKGSKHIYNAKQIVQMLNDKFDSKGGGSETFATAVISNMPSKDILSYSEEILQKK